MRIKIAHIYYLKYWIEICLILILRHFSDFNELYIPIWLITFLAIVNIIFDSTYYISDFRQKGYKELIVLLSTITLNISLILFLNHFWWFGPVVAFVLNFIFAIGDLILLFWAFGGSNKLLSLILFSSLLICQCWLAYKIKQTFPVKKVVQNYEDNRSITSTEKISLFQYTCDLMTIDRDSINREYVMDQKLKYLNYLLRIANENKGKEVDKICNNMSEIIVRNISVKMQRGSIDSLFLCSIRVDSLENLFQQTK